MAKTMHRAVRSVCMLILLSLFVVAGCAAAWYWSDHLQSAFRILGGMSGMTRAAVCGDPAPPTLPQVRTVHGQLRDRWSRLQSRRRDLTDQIRLLRASATLASAQGRADSDETRRRLQCEIRFHTQQLAEIETQIESMGRAMERLDGLLRQLEIDATIAGADRDARLRAAELLWDYDPGRTGPNAVVPMGD